MTVEDAEEIFGKRWSKWTEAEQREYATMLAPDELNMPFNLNMAVKHRESLPLETLAHLEKIAKRNMLPTRN